jgi:hypothetical protein
MMKRHCTITVLTLLLLVFASSVFAVTRGKSDPEGENVTANATNGNNTAGTQSQQGSEEQEAQKVKDFFKDANYEHLEPEKNFEFVSP